MSSSSPPSSLPTTQPNIGLIRQSTGKATLQEIPIPDLQDDYILVRTVAVALNPTDWGSLDGPGQPGTLVGCDYAGVVERVGKAVKRKFEVGERVCGFGHGANDANPQNGAFARYIAVKGDLQMHIPDGISFEEASAAAVGVATTGYGLYKELGLPLPAGAVGVADGEMERAIQGNGEKNGGEPILIYGGSTATGTHAMQFAKLSGLTVITTCSPKHFNLMKDRGADLVFDYHDSKVGEKIQAATNGQLTKVFDTIAIESSAAICAKAIGSSGGVYCNLLGEHDCPRSDVKSIFFLAYSLSGEAYIHLTEHYTAKPEDLVFGTWFMKMAEKLWAQGRWKAHPQRLMPGGMMGISAGMEEMRRGCVSGEKLVYRIGETVWPAQ